MRRLATLLVLGSACTADVDIISEDNNSTSGTSITEARGLSGCKGQASSSIPSNGQYVITTFASPGGAQMSCGGYADGVSWYAASRQRYGCGSHIRVTANGKCVVLRTDDYGPDVCVENAATMPIIDASPAATQYLFGVKGAGWSDHRVVTVEEVSTSEPLGPCSSSTSTPPGSGGGGTCNSSTLDRDVDDGTCVQAASDGEWYQCSAGAWVYKSSSYGCTAAYGWCSSATLGYDVPPRTCLQSASTSIWYQCNGMTWTTPVDVYGEMGPIGACSSMYPL